MALILVIQNVSALADISNYNYEVLVGDGTPARSVQLAAGTVKAHERAAGWQALVSRLLAQHPYSSGLDPAAPPQ